MAYRYLTAAEEATIADKPKKIVITVNKALTGTITVKDDATTIAVITDPAAGARFEYWDFRGACKITPSATCDITVNAPSLH